MPRASQPTIGLLIALLSIAPQLATAGYTVDEQETLTISADFRLRAEHDWDSQRADLSERSDRTRLRLRARLGLTFTPDRWISLGARLRTGSHDSQQSPHITFHDYDDNSTGDHDVMLDRYFVALKNEDARAWVGRNDFPFWRQNEMLWDSDVTVTGASVGYTVSPGLQLRGGWFKLPNGGVDLRGDLAGGQAVYRWAALENLDLTVAGSVFAIRGDDERTRLRNGNGARDYTIWSASVRAEGELGGRPLAVGVDAMHNGQHYTDRDPDAFTVKNRDEVNGFVFVTSFGRASDFGQWQLLYSYAYLEALAVNASYAQDDWVRWGSATQSDSSDLKGHEMRGVLGLGSGMNLVARWYIVDAITSDQDGQRLRLDFNWKL